MILGITGSIGSGKTTVAKLFSRHWYNRIDADEIGHEIIKKNSIAYKKIIKEFGNEILDKNKDIDRNKLGDIVFSDSKKLKQLNLIMHPMIINEIKNQIKNKCGDTRKNQRFLRYRKSKGFSCKTKIVIDSPLLLETKIKDLIDKIIIIKCNKENIIKRLNKKYKKEKIESILNAQMPLNEKLKYADFVIDNNKDLKQLEKQTKKIIEKLNQE